MADDSVTMRRILELTFQGEDAKVTTVDSGEAAVRKAGELNPDVVLADLSQGMDGYAIATAIKSAPGLERTAVIVMASQKHPYDDERGKAAGVDDHILKPFDTQHVIDRVKQIMGKPRTAPSAGAAASAASAADRQSRVGSKTIAFGKPPAAAPAMPAAAPAAAPKAPPMAAKPAPPAGTPMGSPAAAAAASAVAASTAKGSGELERKLGSLGLTADQVQGVLALSREVIEKVVWEVVPDLAETIIKEEIRRLTAG
ncbi:MAG TPA: response regulator [Polyangiales bacterium]|nr:response regulator [Polyangiales bacterium]